jgi:predicted secreted Zn-dependent protease
MTAEDLGHIWMFVHQRPLAALIARPNFVVSVPGVRMIYYPVAGDEASVLMDNWANASSSSTRCGLVEYTWSTGDRRTLSCATAAWTPRYLYSFDAQTKACTIKGASAGMVFSMPIAKWTSPALVSRALVTWWEATQEVVRDHEAGHFAVDRQYGALLTSRLNGAPCASAKGIIDSWSSALNAAQEAYDQQQYPSEKWPPYP